ncbi:uncharacterized protein CTRU02_205539 [Colletotrichum truncatum]|uniref:Uncharacterized protein n=1 Tax=Colletotrichum truncatum TaxID=5467 RepID=A0ACC3Z4B4_COLTU|nr:uncharacterized protein CTRU02_04599 [Colletotrichum truncatum]KAF6795789.1 hypothetical protein CTRU02_04599 [Colletotrichum truncatum]
MYYRLVTLVVEAKVCLMEPMLGVVLSHLLYFYHGEGDPCLFINAVKLSPPPSLRISSEKETERERTECHRLL